MKRFALSVTFVLLVVYGAFSSAKAAPSAEDVVKSTANQVLAKLRSEREMLRQKPTALYQLVNELIIPHFDFRRMSQWVLGRYWRTASDTQRSAFVGEFRTLLVRTYATALLEYSDQKIRYLPVQAPAGAKTVTVKTQVDRPGGSPIPINYRMHDKDGDWKVFDVAVDGVSLVSTYRSTFGSQIRQDGLDALIKVLSARNKELGD
jgi:phospholipid transport system substrate-binding protein